MDYKKLSVLALVLALAGTAMAQVDAGMLGGVIGGAGLVGIIMYLIFIAWTAVPIVFVFIVKSWKERFKALIIWAIVSALVFGLLAGLVIENLTTMLATIVGLFILYIIMGGIIMVVADYISEPVARFIESRW